MSISSSVRALGRGMIPDLSWAPSAAVGLLAAWVMFGQVLLWPWARALGDINGEAPGHVWGLWATSSRIFAYGPLVRVADLSWPQGFSAHLMDPISLVVFFPFYVLGGGGPTGATLGWNALLLSAPLLAAFGCYRLARRVGGADDTTPWAAALLGACVAGSPYLLGTPWLGRSELLPSVLWPLHLAYLHAWLRVPAGEERGLEEAPPLWTGALAGLTLGAMALGGAYMGVFLALLEPPVALWMARRLPLREGLARLGLVAGLGLLCAAPAIWAMFAFPPPAIAHADNAPVSARSFSNYALSQLLHDSSGNLRGTEQPTYVGLVTLGLVLAGLIRSPRRALPWALLGLLGLALSFGPYARLVPRAPGPGGMSEEGLITFPVAWIMALAPKLALLKHWSRMSLLASVLVGVAAMEGFRALAPRAGGRRAALGVTLLTAMILDHATWPRAWSLPRPSFDAAPPTELVQALETLPRGPLVLLPVDSQLGNPFDGFGRGMYQLWALGTERALSAGGLGEEDATLTKSAFTAIVRELQRTASPSGPRRSALLLQPSTSQLACMRSGAITLGQAGYAGVVLFLRRSPAESMSEAIEQALGTPAWRGDVVMAWNLQNLRADASTPSAERCSSFLPRTP